MDNATPDGTAGAAEKIGNASRKRSSTVVMVLAAAAGIILLAYAAYPKEMQRGGFGVANDKCWGYATPWVGPATIDLGGSLGRVQGAIDAPSTATCYGIVMPSKW
ncbi:MAG TPA: hypothetical protein VLC10_03115 [Patescibacteria group bacterium]|nr:hypothetical protein [Patescibacteria group bacterium]